jgi:hypothetical protein
MIKKMGLDSAGSADLEDAVDECRKCLAEHATKRDCCDQYYCDNCFYENTLCPSCGEPIAERNFDDVDLKVTNFQLWGGGLFATVICLGMFAFGGLQIYHFKTLHKTVTGFTCAGLLPKCSHPLDFCVEMFSPNMDQTLDAMGTTGWKRCNANTKKKIRNPMCVFDWSLYSRSDKALGWDYCEAEFTPGIIVFEDSFDEPLASANWLSMDSAYRTTVCGSVNYLDGTSNYIDTWGALPRDAGKAFVFRTGSDSGLKRQAVTPPLDVRDGGKVEFFLKFGDGLEGGGQCKNVGGAIVKLQYSTDNDEGRNTNMTGKKWTTLNTYRTNPYKRVYFTKVVERLPGNAHTSHTMFRWKQAQYRETGDFWAMDDLRITSFSPSNWNVRPDYVKAKAKSVSAVEKAQCCLDSWQCKTLGDPKWDKECSDFKTYGGYRSNNLQGQEMLVLCAFAIAVMRMLVNWLLHLGSYDLKFHHFYVFLKERYDEFFHMFFGMKEMLAKKKEQAKEGMKRKKKNGGKQDGTIVIKVEEKSVSNHVNNRTRVIESRYDGHFKTLCNKKWQLFWFISNTCIGLLICWVSIDHAGTLRDWRIRLPGYGAGKFVENVTFSASYLAYGAAWLDAKVIIYAAFESVFIIPRRAPRYEIIGSKNILHIYRKSWFLNEFVTRIHLEDVHEITEYTREECARKAFVFWLGCWPWASTALLSGERNVGVVMGLLAIAKGLLGNWWLTKIEIVGKYVWYSFWICSSRHHDPIRVAWAKKACSWFSCGVGILTLVVAFPIVILSVLWVIGYDTAEWFLIHLFSTSFGVFAYGYWVAISARLPATPEFLFTHVGFGHQITYKSKPNLHATFHRPCMALQTEMKVFIAFTNDDFMFFDVMRGQPIDGVGAPEPDRNLRINELKLAASHLSATR